MIAGNKLGNKLSIFTHLFTFTSAWVYPDTKFIWQIQIQHFQESFEVLISQYSNSFSMYYQSQTYLEPTQNLRWMSLLKFVYYFCKKIQLRCLSGFWICLSLLHSATVCNIARKCPWWFFSSWIDTVF